MSMELERDRSLAGFNTFGIAATAKYFVAVDSVDKLQSVLDSFEGPAPFILGGGSNLLLTGDVKGLVLKNEIKGKRLEPLGEGKMLLTAGGGENWHELVRWSLNQGLGGLENLSLIPGTVGAAPIQNIGAYGVELQEVFHHLEAVNIQTGKLHRFDKEDCQFGYRNSIFKNELKGQYFITRVAMVLTTENHRIETSYGAIQQELSNHHITKPTPKDISDAVIRIRSSKLPDPAEIGNSGSFFKNPVVSKEQFGTIARDHPEAPYYPLPDGSIKVPAGWLIEQCGWKGKRVGNTGTYKNQALVLVNHGNATGMEVWEHAERIMESVEKQFGIRLQPEVNVL